ncbi:DUF3179 domain-containing protein [candidate division GN15 bacterium]|nr:DUF3179 domain-containing protein [candidate division GN15 bacterium]
MRTCVTSGFLLAFTILCPGSDLSAQHDKPQETMIRGHVMYTLLKPGDIPALTDPDYLSVSEADELYYPGEPLLAVVDGDSAKAYSTWHLDHHEVVNDYINGKAITVTW